MNLKSLINAPGKALQQQNQQEEGALFLT